MSGAPGQVERHRDGCVLFRADKTRFDKQRCQGEVPGKDDHGLFIKQCPAFKYPYCDKHNKELPKKPRKSTGKSKSSEKESSGKAVGYLAVSVETGEAQSVLLPLDSEELDEMKAQIGQNAGLEPNEAGQLLTTSLILHHEEDQEEEDREEDEVQEGDEVQTLEEKMRKLGT